ncbi:MAG: EamA family transporter [Polaribacter sp.]|jgi:drug/metabolite transporter (DMT)-like permease|nr:EamA family transporter [Polaribacter sp.]MBT7136145.1 EamA family transporter [Polaribacter sp.]MDA9362936.1 EamA family transporter [Polaribacter sp.]MDC1461802.1 EamA family transporter [Polaribacter sp.]MDG1221921.1 EamA family transporter [Polaribacter sp.]
MIYLILAMLLFSFNNVLWKKNLLNISVSLLMTYRSFFTSILAISFLFYFHDLTEFSFIQISRTLTTAILGLVGLFSMLTLYKKASLQWAAIYNLLGIIFTTLYLWIFKEFDIKSSFLGIFIITIGFIFYIYTKKKSTLKINLKQHLLLVLMTLCFGTAAILNWENLNQKIPVILIIANQEVLVFICGIVLLFLERRKRRSSIQLLSIFQKYFYRVLLMSIVILLGLFFSFLGLEITNPIISGVLFLASPLTTILFSAYFFKEKIKVTDWIAIGVISFGAFLLHLQTT